MIGTHRLKRWSARRGARTALLLAAAAVLPAAGLTTLAPSAAYADGATLLSQGATATASSVQGSDNSASAAFDGNTTTTRWASDWNANPDASTPEWLQVDLGDEADVSGITLYWESAYADQFEVDGSDDGTNWTPIDTVTDGTGGVETLTGTGTARYVRITMTHRGGGLTYGYSIYEMQVFGSWVDGVGPQQGGTGPGTDPGTGSGGDGSTPTACGTNAALGKTATASSANGANTAANAVDGNATGTRWESQQGVDPQWLEVDLGSSQSICGLQITWEAAYASAFQIQVSEDTQNWTTVYSGSGVVGTDPIVLDQPVSGRYVRMYGTQRATAYGYSIYEFAVYSTGADGNDQAVAEKSCAAGTANTTVPQAPDFGPNVTILNPGMQVSDINTALEAASTETEMSSGRHAVFFLPGTYGCADGNDGSTTSFADYSDGQASSYADLVNGEVGYYEQVAGLGASPDDVSINGALHVDAVQGDPSAPWNAQAPGSLDLFWRSLSNVEINPNQKPAGADAQLAIPEGVVDQGPGTMRWAVSQADPMRRVDINGNLSLFGRYGEEASGGYLADSKIDGEVSAGSQQQFYTRDSSIGGADGGVWNMVYSGVTGAPAQNFPPTSGTPTTTLATTPESREAPFLFVDSSGDYNVFVPNAGTDTSGVNWATDAAHGRTIGIDDFFIAKPSDSISAINGALASGKNLILTPGVYSYDKPIMVTNPDTVILGLGMATLSPSNGKAAITTGDVKGAIISGLIVDAGPVTSPVLLQIGPAGSAHSGNAVASDPTSLSDVFVRIGGAQAGSVDTAIEVNSSDVILDDIWSWRADHGTGVGWTVNTAANGLVVNGDDVTATGLAVEHYQQNQVLWNGNGGTTVFYQSELPYDVPSQDAWTDDSGGTSRNGYASYRVADTVTSHHAYGLGIYSYFNQGIDIVEDSAIQAPKSPGVQFSDMVTRFLNGNGQITHVIDDQGAEVRLAQSGEDSNAVETSYLGSFPGPDTTAPTLTLSASPAAPGASGWYTGPVTITPSASDDFTPAPTVEASIDGGDWASVNGAVTVSGDGSHTVQFRATDSSGNVSDVASWSGKIDATAPVVTETTDSSAGTVTLTASDAGSGVAKIEYVVGSAKATSSSSWTSYTAPIQVSGTQLVSYRATDAAGNVSAIGSVTVTHKAAGGGGSVSGIVEKIVSAIVQVVKAVLTTIKNLLHL